MCIPCKNAGYCIEGVARTYTEAARNVRDQNIPAPQENAALFFKSRLRAWMFDKYLRRQARRMARAEGKQMSKKGLCICDVCGEAMIASHYYVDRRTGLEGHWRCLQTERDKNLEELYGPDDKRPDWDKIKKLAQRMNGLVDEIEKEIESGESRPFQNCFEDCPLGQKG